METNKFKIIDDYDDNIIYYVILHKRVNIKDIQNAINDYKENNEDNTDYLSILDFIDNQFGIEECYDIETSETIYI